jgi:hypothetical protein
MRDYGGGQVQRRSQLPLRHSRGVQSGEQLLALARRGLQPLPGGLGLPAQPAGLLQLGRNLGGRGGQRPTWTVCRCSARTIRTA